MTLADFQARSNKVATSGTPSDIIMESLRLIRTEHLEFEEYMIRYDAACNVAWLRDYRERQPKPEKVEFQDF